MSAGWYPDPTGRFPARYFDGTDWSDQVQGADGQVSADAIERRSSGLAAPAPVAAPAPAWGAPPAPAWGAPGMPAASPWGAGPGAPAAEVQRGSGYLGLAIAGVGWLLALLSLFALDWVEGGTRSDLSDSLPSSLPDGVDLADQVWFTYLSWAAIALFVLVAIGLVVTLITASKGDPTAPRLLVGAVAALAAVLHAETVVRALGDNAEVGAQLGIAAYVLVVVGLAIGSRTTRPA